MHLAPSCRSRLPQIKRAETSVHLAFYQTQSMECKLILVAWSQQGRVPVPMIFRRSTTNNDGIDGYVGGPSCSTLCIHDRAPLWFDIKDNFKTTKGLSARPRAILRVRPSLSFIPSRLSYFRRRIAMASRLRARMFFSSLVFLSRNVALR